MTSFRISGHYPEVKGQCPHGCGATLFLGEGGYVTCSFIDCPDPVTVSVMLECVFDPSHSRRKMLLAVERYHSRPQCDCGDLCVQRTDGTCRLGYRRGMGKVPAPLSRSDSAPGGGALTPCPVAPSGESDAADTASEPGVDTHSRPLREDEE